MEKRPDVLRPPTGRNYDKRGDFPMMNDGMMWGMGWGGLLILVLVILAIAALVKYIFFK